MSARLPLSVLHLVGNHGDHGGILSVIRALQSATQESIRHVVWVNRDFRQTRQPTLELRPNPHAVDEDRNHLRLLLRNLQAWPALKGLLRKEAFDVVHAHTRGSLPLALLLARSRPVLFTNHTYANRGGLYRFAAARRRMRTVLLTANMARHYGLTPSPGRLEIVSACCDDSWFERPLPAPSCSSPAEVLQLVGVGNLVRWKKWDLIVRALATLPPELRNRLRLTVWGPVPEDADARAFAEELTGLIQELKLGPIVTLAGPTNDVPSALSAADTFLLPSTNEPCSVALMEALASGRPVVASRSGGNLDIVREGRTGLLFQPDDVADLAAQLRQLLDGTFRPVAPAEIRESVRMRSATAVGAEHRRIYKELAEAR